MQSGESFNETEAIKDLQKDVKSIIKHLETLTKLKTGEAEVLDQLGKSLKALPPSEIIGQAIDELRVKGTKLYETACHQRAEGFKRCETTFIRGAKEMGKSVREFSQGWRIGPLELQAVREESRASFLYNGEILIKWKSVSSADDLAEMEKKALSMLEQAALPQEILVNVFWEAYQEAGRRNPKGFNQALVPLADLYREVRICLIRYSLDGKSLQKKLDQYTDFPKWAYLYNLDLLRAMGSNIVAERRLAFQTGSMNEVSKGKGFKLNGLDAMNEYKVMVYVSAASGAAQS